ncbi:uncharacterized protein IL334_000404 [Kwoniella shivajii]|uniref:Protein kinase domain-containing protein n=1 Tax=Kwoniella shivajii TaxID=564305 RepID=A0ABZ1CQJ1_9TREE|nr:hypothetical protein IL334_000404 [Kwoniella shivajii]
MGVTHRDLKPENILLTRETADAPVTVKIADFGLAKMVHNQTMLVSMVGTPQYLAPEVVMQDKQQPGYENVVDSWSVGIIVYSMMTKALPFDEDGEIPVEQRIKARFTQPADEELLHRLGISQVAIDFISGLLAKDPRARTTMAQALDHEWLSGPSSQITASQPQSQHILGGDSVWSIESFDEDYPPSNGADLYGDNTNDDLGRWSRPMTASGTNYESLGEYPSEESFSQPMGNLHLNTPLNQRMIKQEYKSERISSEIPISSEPISPPSSALLVDLDTKKKKDGDNGDINVGLLTPITPNMKRPDQPTNGGDVNVNIDVNTISKRKNDDDLFSSGSLSPPPISSKPLPKPIPQSGPQNKDENVLDAAVEVSSKPVSIDKSLPTRQSTRSTRVRKSMRLA